MNVQRLSEGNHAPVQTLANSETMESDATRVLGSLATASPATATDINGVAQGQNAGAPFTTETNSRHPATIGDEPNDVRSRRMAPEAAIQVSSPPDRTAYVLELSTSFVPQRVCATMLPGRTPGALSLAAPLIVAHSASSPRKDKPRALEQTGDVRREETGRALELEPALFPDWQMANMAQTRSEPVSAGLSGILTPPPRMNTGACTTVLRSSKRKRPVVLHIASPDTAVRSSHKISTPVLHTSVQAETTPGNHGGTQLLATLSLMNGCQLRVVGNDEAPTNDTDMIVPSSATSNKQPLTPFPVTTYNMVNVLSATNPDVMRWTPSGDAFFVDHKHPGLEVVLRKYFQRKSGQRGMVAGGPQLIDRSMVSFLIQIPSTRPFRDR
jgi:hypothetical protein